jgi:uncharacterized protein YlaI
MILPNRTCAVCEQSGVGQHLVLTCASIMAEPLARWICEPCRRRIAAIAAPRQ